MHVIMSAQQIKYELLGEDTPPEPIRHRHLYVQVCILLVLCIISSVAVFIIWTVIYRHHVNVPPTTDGFPSFDTERANRLANTLHIIQNDPNTTAEYDNKSNSADSASAVVKLDDHEIVYPSRLGSFLSASYPYDYDTTTAKTSSSRSGSSSNTTTATTSTTPSPSTRLVCYYAASDRNTPLQPANIHPHLCTHINIGMAAILDDELHLNEDLQSALRSSVASIKAHNPAVHLLLWVGGGSSAVDMHKKKDDNAISGFAAMVRTHASRMRFVHSVRLVLQQFRLDGIDLDWEFPSASLVLRERQHFSQLLHELRREYQRSRRTYLLSVAVAAPETIARLSYDAGEIEQYVDHVNVMTYDYHAWSPWTPFTGLNAPLAVRAEEEAAGYLRLLNMNASLRFWQAAGLSRAKIVLGLPTYGHSFKLVNGFNANIMSPASGFGDLGKLGFVTYPDVCWFMRNNYFVRRSYDKRACSPYLSAGLEWLSYEDDQSVACKANFVTANGYGGAMVFSLNADDWRGRCASDRWDDGDEQSDDWRSNDTFPLVRRIYATLFGRPVPST